MRDDFQIPNMGTAEDKYDQSFLRRMVRNVETTFEALRAKGKATFSDLTADNLTINGSSINITDPAAFRTAIDAQEQWPNLDAIGPLASAANTVPYFTGSGAAALTGLTATGRDIIDSTSTAEARQAVGLNTYVVTNSFTNAASTPHAILNLDAMGTPRQIEVDLWGAPTTTASTITLRHSINNGSSWVSGATDYNGNFLYTATGTTTAQSTNIAQTPQNGMFMWGGTSNIPISTSPFGAFTKFTMFTTSGYTRCVGNQVYYANVDSRIYSGHTVIWMAHGPVNALQLNCSQAFTCQYTIKVYY